MLLFLALLMLTGLSIRPFSNALLWGLEHQYSPILDPTEFQGVKYIVVLTAWDSDNPAVPYTSNIGYRSTLRVLEAHRLFIHLKNCRLLISGNTTGTKVMRQLFLLLGFNESRMILDDYSQNTWESAKSVKHILGNEPFLLVTSAIHLPRAMFCFSKEGLMPVPAPADFSYGYYKRFIIPFKQSLSYYLPNTSSLKRSNEAIYEYLGIWYYNLKAMKFLE